MVLGPGAVRGVHGLFGVCLAYLVTDLGTCYSVVPFCVHEYLEAVGIVAKYVVSAVAKDDGALFRLGDLSEHPYLRRVELIQWGNPIVRYTFE